MAEPKALFAIYKIGNVYVARYDKEAVRGILTLRKALLDEAVELMRFHNERQSGKTDANGQGKRRKSDKGNEQNIAPAHTAKRPAGANKTNKRRPPRELKK